MQKDGEIRWQNVYFVIFFAMIKVFLEAHENPMNFLLNYKITVVVCYTYVIFCV